MYKTIAHKSDSRIQGMLCNYLNVSKCFSCRQILPLSESDYDSYTCLPGGAPHLSRVHSLVCRHFRTLSWLSQRTAHPHVTLSVAIAARRARFAWFGSTRPRALAPSPSLVPLALLKYPHSLVISCQTPTVLYCTLLYCTVRHTRAISTTTFLVLRNRIS